MKSPITGKEMEIRNEMKDCHYKGFDIPYMQTSYYCKDSGENFTTTEQDEIHMERIEKKFRILKGYPNKL